AMERNEIPDEKLRINIDRYGNTSAASVPIILHELRSEGKLAAGDLAMFVAFGAGLTWAANVWRV
ncbi:MAG: 3-oxoacyl-[acyl-carrier-protein] synthase III C-terminal domain-containing protein, partial [Planctomycetota bacterium]|nr:3-oxoacyl-[acyl-carrier-protein] synthase III C-terminal domain-containing protein [Planctomycetota bacterium]